MSGDRWDRFIARSKSCYRASASIDAARAALQAAQLDLENEARADRTPALEELRRELIAAEGHVFAAREAVKAALDERKLTPENREAAFWKAGAR